jgi:capsid protein
MLRSFEAISQTYSGMSYSVQKLVHRLKNRDIAVSFPAEVRNFYLLIQPLFHEWLSGALLLGESDCGPSGHSPPRSADVKEFVGIILPLLNMS